jgi:lambda family phage tail tape measure protein
LDIILAKAATEKERLAITKRQLALTEALTNVTDKIAAAKFETDISGLDPLQKQLAKIGEDNRIAATEAGRAYMAQFEGMKMTAAQATEAGLALAAIADRYKELSVQQEENAKMARTWTSGWADAFNEYVDNATNAAMQAKNIFGAATQGMEDMIVNFAKTGKLEWKSFVNDMLTTLLRSQLQQTIAKVMGSMGGASMGSGGGGLFGGALIPGFLASGGPASKNRSYIVGERGPELFTPASNGTVSPTGSFGGGQNITYNISAVDAHSFQALVARDPEFIHAVAMAGARNTTRR